jgi:hypothetical protein
MARLRIPKERSTLLWQHPKILFPEKETGEGEEGISFKGKWY